MKTKILHSEAIKLLAVLKRYVAFDVSECEEDDLTAEAMLVIEQIERRKAPCSQRRQPRK
jgi:hypothetical protein